MNFTAIKLLINRVKLDKSLINSDIAEAIGVSKSRFDNFMAGRIKDYDDIQAAVESKFSAYFSNLDADLIPNATPMGAIQPSPEHNIYHVPVDAYAGFSHSSNPIKNDELTGWSMPFIDFKGWSFKVSGESMKDTLMDGEIVVVSRDPIPTMQMIVNDWIHVLETPDGSYVIKRVVKGHEGGIITIQSDNEDHKDYEWVFGTDFVRAWVGRRIVKWDLSKRDMVGRTPPDEEAEKLAAKLDRKAVEEIQRKSIEFDKDA